MAGVPNSGILQISPSGYPGGGLPLDLTPYLDVNPSDGMDPANAAFTQRIFSHSLLKEGGVLALENLQLKELRFPLRLFGQGQLLQNLVPNPSFEWDMAGSAPAAWSPSSPAFFLTSGATLSVTAAQAQIGKQALQIATTASAGEGAAIQLAGSFVAGTTYTFSVWLKGNVGGESLTLALGAASADSASAPVVLTSGWQRFDVIWTPSSNETTVYAVIKSAAASAITVFADAAMVTVASGLTVYQDGDQPGWQWLGAPGNSVSSNYFARDGVAALVQRLNAQVNLPGQTVLWQDQGSGQPTYFDLASGQFDVEYDFRAAGNYWIKGMLRLFVQPLGHTATMRLVASAAGTGPLLMLPIPSPILGDANALMQATVGLGGYASPAFDYAAVSVLPAGYTPEYQASAMVGGSNILVASLTGGSGGVASLFWHLAGTAGLPLTQGAQYSLVTFKPSVATAHRGLNRMLAIARHTPAASAPAATAALYIQPTGLGVWWQQPISATSQVGFLSAATGWQLLDLGTYMVPSSIPSPPPITMNVIYVSPSPAQAQDLFVDITDIIVLPDGNSVFAVTMPTGALLPSQALYFDGVNGESMLNAFWRETPYQRGQIPKVPVGASCSLAVLAFGNGPAPPANDAVAACIQVRERCRFAF